MSSKISKELAIHRLEQAKQELKDAELLYKNNSFKSANNRAYYSIFHSMRAVLALEGKDFKKHKDIQGYFNKNYVHAGIFPKKMGAKIAIASKMREDSDYDDEFIVRSDDTENQIQTARELLRLVYEYVDDFR